MINCVFENGSPASLRHVVVHAIVEKDGALLLGRRAPHLLEGGKLGLPGGFLDRDESLSEGRMKSPLPSSGFPLTHCHRLTPWLSIMGRRYVCTSNRVGSQA